MIGKLDVFTQLHITRRLAPMVAAILSGGKDLTLDTVLTVAATKIADSLSNMSDQDMDFVIKACLSVCKRRQVVGDTEAWAPVMPNGHLAFQDMDIGSMLGLTVNVIQENLGSFFPTAPPTPEK